MIVLEHRQHSVEIIDGAVVAGARFFKPCEEVGIHTSTYRHWQDQGVVGEDRRPTASRPSPANNLESRERGQLLSLFHDPEFASLPPSQVVPTLTDRGIYMASESTCYRILHEANQQHDRGRARARQPLGNQLQAANGQIVMEDLTPSQLRGEIKKIETEFYRVFNASNEDKDLAVVCYDYLPTGTNIKQDICEPQFVVAKRADNANDSRLGIDVLLTPKGLRRDLALEYEALTAAMTKVTEESEYFRELK